MADATTSAGTLPSEPSADTKQHQTDDATAVADPVVPTEDVGPKDDAPSPPSSPDPRRTSRQWDASKVPPSQFQKRKGSIFATPAARDGHVQGADRDRAFHEKLKDKSLSLFGIFGRVRLGEKK